MAWGSRLAASRAARVAFAMMLALVQGTSFAQAQATDTVPQTADEALDQMAVSAAMIFSGEVTAVRRPGMGGSGLTGVVEIDFAVEDPIRGVSGGTYTLREWAGLWTGVEPFRVGQRYLMLLHAPGPGGLSSPVGGGDGAIPVRGAAVEDTGTSSPARAMATTAAGSVEEASPIGSLVIDLRWVGTHAAHPIVYTKRVSARPIPSQGRVVTLGGQGEQEPIVLAAPPAVAAATPSAQESYGTVMTRLYRAEQSNHATR